MSRKLDLQLYLALNDYPLKEIPKERFEDYMSEPYYSTDFLALPQLLATLRAKGFYFTIRSNFSYQVELGYNGVVVFAKDMDSLLMALCKAVYKYYTGKEWEGEGE